MQMRKKSIITFCFVVVAAIVLSLVAFSGFPGSLNEKDSGIYSDSSIMQSSDLVGVLELTFRADAEDPTNEQMAAVEEIYKARLNLAGYTEARVSRDGRNVTIAIPSDKSLSDKSKENAEGAMPASEQTKAVVELLTKVAKLTFSDYSGQVVLEGSSIQSAEMQHGRPTGTDKKEYYVQLEFTSEGAKQFSAATETAAAQPEG